MHEGERGRGAGALLRRLHPVDLQPGDHYHAGRRSPLPYDVVIVTSLSLPDTSSGDRLES
jgi:hypothetical protein